METTHSSFKHGIHPSMNRWIRLFGLLLLGLALIGFTACEDDEENPRAPVSDQDREFAIQATYSNLAEIAMGQLALTETEDELVRQFAQMMVTEHTQVQDQLRYLAESYELEIPDTLNIEQQALHEELEQLEGYTFDSAYISSQVTAHQQAQQIFQKQIDQGENPEVVKLASSTLPHINAHLTQAMELKEGLASEE
jgi:putative membrane protein